MEAPGKKPRQAVQASIPEGKEPWQATPGTCRQPQNTPDTPKTPPKTHHLQGASRSLPGPFRALTPPEPVPAPAGSSWPPPPTTTLHLGLPTSAITLTATLSYTLPSPSTRPNAALFPLQFSAFSLNYTYPPSLCGTGHSLSHPRHLSSDTRPFSAHPPSVARRFPQRLRCPLHTARRCDSHARFTFAHHSPAPGLHGTRPPSSLPVYEASRPGRCASIIPGSIFIFPPLPRSGPAAFPPAPQPRRNAPANKGPRDPDLPALVLATAPIRPIPPTCLAKGAVSRDNCLLISPVAANTPQNERPEARRRVARQLSPAVSPNRRHHRRGLTRNLTNRCRPRRDHRRPSGPQVCQRRQTLFCT